MNSIIGRTFWRGCATGKVLAVVGDYLLVEKTVKNMEGSFDTETKLVPASDLEGVVFGDEHETLLGKDWYSIGALAKDKAHADNMTEEEIIELLNNKKRPQTCLGSITGYAGSDHVLFYNFDQDRTHVLPISHFVQPIHLEWWEAHLRFGRDY